MEGGGRMAGGGVGRDWQGIREREMRREQRSLIGEGRLAGRELGVRREEGGVWQGAREGQRKEGKVKRGGSKRERGSRKERGERGIGHRETMVGK